MNILSILFITIACNTISAQTTIEIIDTYLERKKIYTYNDLLFVSIKKQKMYRIKNKIIIEEFIISTSEYGVGNKYGSNKTPVGLHRVKEKYGSETPIYGRMVGRKFTGEIAKIYTDKTKSKTDDVTSRIFWLEGLETGINSGKNIDSFKRYIYIHGTSEEGRLGNPASHGCIRMRNKEVIDLFKVIEVGTLVLIL